MPPCEAGAELDTGDEIVRLPMLGLDTRIALDGTESSGASTSLALNESVGTGGKARSCCLGVADKSSSLSSLQHISSFSTE